MAEWQIISKFETGGSKIYTETGLSWVWITFRLSRVWITWSPLAAIKCKFSSKARNKKKIVAIDSTEL